MLHGARPDLSFCVAAEAAVSGAAPTLSPTSCEALNPERLANDALEATAFGVTIRVCSLTALREMKRAAGRPQDLQDLADLGAAHPDK